MRDAIARQSHKRRLREANKMARVTLKRLEVAMCTAIGAVAYANQAGEQEWQKPTIN